jgi:hypothetical protein
LNEVDATFDLEAREARREAEAEQRKQVEAQLESDYIMVMSTYAGRNVIWNLIAPLWRSSYTGTREDTDFREGERNVALRIWAQLLKSCPTLATKMQGENT